MSAWYILHTATWELEYARLSTITYWASNGKNTHSDHLGPNKVAESYFHH